MNPIASATPGTFGPSHNAMAVAHATNLMELGASACHQWEGLFSPTKLGLNMGIHGWKMDEKWVKHEWNMGETRVKYIILVND